MGKYYKEKIKSQIWLFQKTKSMATLKKKEKIEGTNSQI